MPQATFSWALPQTAFLLSKTETVKQFYYMLLLYSVAYSIFILKSKGNFFLASGHHKQQYLYQPIPLDTSSDASIGTTVVKIMCLRAHMMHLSLGS